MSDPVADRALAEVALRIAAEIEWPPPLEEWHEELRIAAELRAMANDEDLPLVLLPADNDHVRVREEGAERFWAALDELHTLLGGERP